MAGGPGGRHDAEPCGAGAGVPVAARGAPVTSDGGAPARRRGVGPGSARGAVATALLLLTAASGVVDAVSYLALDSVFTANMTGNVLFLGFAAAGVAHLPLLNTAVALVAFALGAVVAGRAVPHGATRGVPREAVVTLVAATLGSAVLCVAWFVVPRPGGVAVLVGTVLLAGLSGAQAAAIKPLGNADITTVVVTGTLVNLARDSRLAGAPRRERHVQQDRALAVVAIALGALVGAALVREASAATALAASVVLRAAALAVLVVVRRSQRDAPGRAGPG